VVVPGRFSVTRNGSRHFLQVGSGAPSTKPEKGGGALAQAWRRVESIGDRLEEVLARQVRGVGPFVAIGAPTEPLPELGAARAYFSNDTWQSAIIRWVDLAGLIITVIGPTKWIRWELDTIIERDALSKLIILMPPGLPDDRAARWQNVISGIQATRWGSSLAMVDPETVIAIGSMMGDYRSSRAESAGTSTINTLSASCFIS
jgi:hypothetical protein